MEAEWLNIATNWLFIGWHVILETLASRSLTRSAVRKNKRDMIHGITVYGLGSDFSA